MQGKLQKSLEKWLDRRRQAVLLPVDGHRETWPVRSLRFRSWLRRLYYQAAGGAPSPAQLKSALDTLEAQAQFDAPRRTVYVRVAEQDGRLYLDLADEHWRAVEVGPEGWRVMASPPVRFRRAAGMLPLAVPVKGGSINDLAPFLNLPGRSDFVLVVAWLLAALRQGGPYPLLAVSGEQGSAKTVLSKILRALVDPNAAPVRTMPREERDLFIAASNGHLLAFDNLSDIPARTSDALCRLASGGSFAVRQLYTDADEVLFEAVCPAILNGIEDVITRPDLADRAIFLTLPYVHETARRPEKEIWQEFEIAQPRILGALLEAASYGLRMLPTIRLERLPRMADFALWATGCETAFWPAGTFLRAYEANRRAAIESVIEADPVASGVRDIMAAQTTWAGNASDLLRLGAKPAGNGGSARDPSWPKSPRALAGRLRRSQTALRTLGIEIAFGREGRTGTRIIRMTNSPQNEIQRTVSTVSTVGPADGSKGPGSRAPAICKDADGADGAKGLPMGTP
jgi:hypothetical protein